MISGIVCFPRLFWRARKTWNNPQEKSHPTSQNIHRTNIFPITMILGIYAYVFINCTLQTMQTELTSYKIKQSSPMMTNITRLSVKKIFHFQWSACSNICTLSQLQQTLTIPWIMDTCNWLFFIFVASDSQKYHLKQPRRMAVQDNFTTQINFHIFISISDENSNICLAIFDTINLCKVAGLGTNMIDTCHIYLKYWITGFSWNEL